MHHGAGVLRGCQNLEALSQFPIDTTTTRGCGYETIETIPAVLAVVAFS